MGFLVRVFWDNVLALAKSKRITRKEIAAALGVTVGCISHLVRSRRRTYLDAVPKLAKLLDVPQSILLSEEDPIKMSASKPTLVAPVASIFTSIDGEVCSNTVGHASGQGMLTTFVRLGGCNLFCKWCDTKHAQPKASPRYSPMSTEQVVEKILDSGQRRVTITGGEPLLHPVFVSRLTQQLRNVGIKTCWETNGTVPIAGVVQHLPDSIVMDYKMPSAYTNQALTSVEKHQQISTKNLTDLRSQDWVKCVIADQMDYRAAFRVHQMKQLCHYPFQIAFSPMMIYDAVQHKYTARVAQQLVEWVKRDNLIDVTIMLQIHKMIWPEINSPDQEV